MQGCQIIGNQASNLKVESNIFNHTTGNQMKKSLVLFVIALIISINFDGCKENSTQPVAQIKGDYIIPLVIGNKWIGEVKLFEYNGNLLKTRMDTMKIDKDTIINGEKWYKSSEVFYKNDSWGFKEISPYLGHETSN